MDDNHGTQCDATQWDTILKLIGHLASSIKVINILFYPHFSLKEKPHGV